MQQLISVLMPVYNAAPFLEECLDSILKQTETHWELIAVDDFSKDESFEILSRYAAKDTRIRVLKNEKKGIIPALQTAYQAAKGAYITRMDADDRMMPVKLQTLKNLLIQNGKGHVATGLVMYFSEGELGGGYQRYEQWLNDLTAQQQNFRDIYKECVIPSPCWMVHREDLDTCNAFEPQVYPEDYDLCFRFYRFGLKVVSTTGTLHLWRDHATRTSRNDDNYANNQYFDLKLPYFIRLEYKGDKPLVLWGAGRKGKRLARMLEKMEIPFLWVCNSPNKWGVIVHSAKIERTEIIHQIDNPQIIIAVAAPEGQQEILDCMQKNNWENGKDYFFFC